MTPTSVVSSKWNIKKKVISYKKNKAFTLFIKKSYHKGYIAMIELLVAFLQVKDNKCVLIIQINNWISSPTETSA